MNSYRAGRWAEYYVMLYFIGLGYWPKAVRYKTKVGEVDLIVRRGRTLACVEVKYRQGREDGLYAIRPQSQSRIRRATEQYLLENHYESDRLNIDVRFDAVVVSGNLFIKHIKNAF